MKTALAVLLGVATFSILGGVAATSFQLAQRPPLERPHLGVRGRNRTQALAQSTFFAAIEPALRLLAAWLHVIPMASVRQRLSRLLLYANEYKGLSEDELIAASVLGGAGLAACTWLLSDLLALSLAWSVCALWIGILAPVVRVQALGRTHSKSIGRALPNAVELAAMCMSAGLDFPGALRQIVDNAADSNQPLIEELRRVLQELDLGHTRKTAMEGFAQRVPTEPVREFVNSVVQAEEKGSPLASVLAIQAQTQRLRRSIAAEEMASGAALMLLGPMTLIFLCVIVLLLGPVVVRFMTGGFGPA